VPPAGGRAQAIAEAEAEPLLEEAFERLHLEHLHGRVLELLGTVARLGSGDRLHAAEELEDVAAGREHAHRAVDAGLAVVDVADDLTARGSAERTTAASAAASATSRAMWS
jgi:hypothetical protein